MGEFAKTIDWYRTQLTRLQVRVELGRKVTPAEIATIDADVVILATGARPAPAQPIAGAAGSAIQIRTPWQIIAAPPSNTHLVVIDEGGGRTALAAADAALDANRVTVVSTAAAVGELVNPNQRTPLYKRLLGGGAIFRAAEALVRIEGTAVITRNIYSGDEARIDDVGMLADWRGNRVVDDLNAAISARGFEHIVIGDALAPRQVHMAIAEGALAARRV
jgi:pyruvate/2-oxoglutarate dehydrogenase complex dihydrolipoamide dehydrogenase (E3) component